jgi:molybdopterin guanine dinucleotide-containing S/N-oxide reductase-like protein
MATKKNNPGKIATVEKSYCKGLGLCSVSSDANSSVVDVKNGKILRIRPLHYDWKYKPEEFRPWKIEARGQVFEPSMKSLIPPFSLCYKKRAYSPNRILYPLKRVDWDPNGERNPQNRGKSGYVRISWDEALDIITSEIRRVIKKYGSSYTILAQGDGHGETKTVHAGHGAQRKLLDLLGGYTSQQRNTDSWEGWYWGAKHVWGCEPVGEMDPLTNVFPDIADYTELMLLWGCDMETTTWGWQGQLPSRMCYWFTELGMKQIYICPEVNYGAAVHADKWIPILPNTDAAMRLAIAYVWLTEGTYDKDYIATHSVGFDKFAEYVLGKEDGIPKTPKWAEGKCGVPSRITKALAREWASKRTSIGHGNGGSAIRGPYAHEPARLEIYLLGMQGLGKPGVHFAKWIEWGLFCAPGQYPMPQGVVFPDVNAANHGQRTLSAAVKKAMEDDGESLESIVAGVHFVPKTLIHDAILKPPLTWYGTTSAGSPRENQFVQYKYPADGCPEVHMIWSTTPCLTTCWNDSNTTTRAYRSPKIEFYLVQHPWMENDCHFADLLLPVNTELEEEDISADTFSGQFHTVMFEDQCIVPKGESKTDYEVVCMIAERLGLLKEYTRGRSVDDWIKFAYDYSGITDKISLEELKEKKYYVVPTDPEWKKLKPGLRGFYEDPDNNRLTTPSGKLEYYSQALAEHFPDDKERPPVAHWVEKSESHDERLSSERAKDYPLLIMSNHGRWRVHANLDDISWFHEIVTCKVKGPDGYHYEPIWINPADAAKRGIANGDVVRIYNERGSVLTGAYVTERMMPGVVYVDHGARYDPIVIGELDRGGAINTISPHNGTSKNCWGMATSGYLVEIERADIDELRKKYPEAFNRPYDRATGQVTERVMA